jgi:hypothetical protein
VRSTPLIVDRALNSFLRGMQRGRALMLQAKERRASAALASAYKRWVRFYWRHCRSGFPWYWPARPPGHVAMVGARRMVR